MGWGQLLFAAASLDVRLACHCRVQYVDRSVVNRTFAGGESLAGQGPAGFIGNNSIENVVLGMQSSTQNIDVGGIFRILWYRRWWILLGAILGGLAGVVVAIRATPLYRAEVLLQPVKKNAGGGALQALAGQFGGLANLAGLDMGGGDDAAVAVATLKSRRVTGAYIAEKNLLPILYSAQWDAKTGAWKNSDPKKVPTVWSAEQFFDRKVRNVSENRSTGLVTMTIEWDDPKLAAQWANDLVVRAGDLLRSEAHDNARRNIEFLEKQLQDTTIVEVRQTLNQLLEQQWNKLMLAQGDSEYAFRTVDPAEVPRGKANLPKKLVVLIWIFIGLAVSGAVAIVERMVWIRDDTGAVGDKRT